MPAPDWKGYVRLALCALLAGLFIACSAGTPPTPPTTPTPPTGGNPNPPPAPPAGPPTVSITGTGFSPAEITVSVGERVTFINNDSRAHDILGGVDHQNRECPEIDTAAFLVPGQRRDTEPFTASGTCNFHDHTQLGNPAYQGKIHIR